MKVTRKQVSIVALSMAAFVVLAGVLLYFQFREPRYEGKTFSEWVNVWYQPGLSEVRRNQVVDAILGMGPRVIPWLQEAMVQEISPRISLKTRITKNLPSWLAVRFRLKPAISILPSFACPILHSLEPDGASTVPLLMQLAAKPNSWQFEYISQLQLYLPPAKQMVPLLQLWVTNADWTGDSELLGKPHVLKLLSCYPDEAVNQLPNLQKLLDGQQWLAATKTIASCGPAARDALPSLEVMLTDTNKRSQAALAIAKIAPERTDEMAAILFQILETGELVTKANALGPLRSLGPKSFPALPSLIALLRTATFDVGASGAATIGAIGPAAKAAIGILQAASDGKAKAAGVANKSVMYAFTPDDAARWERVEALIALTRIDPSLSDECGTKLALILRSMGSIKLERLIAPLAMDNNDPKRISILLGLLERNADDLLPSMVRFAWSFDFQTSQRLAPFLTRVIERNSKGNPLRTKAIKALRLIAPLEAGRYQ